MNSITRSRNKVTPSTDRPTESTRSTETGSSRAFRPISIWSKASTRTSSLQQGGKDIVGYDKGGASNSRHQSRQSGAPRSDRGCRRSCAKRCTARNGATVPAFFADCQLSKRGNIVAKSSVSRNHRFPTLNDLYFLPGGNPDLRSESGFSYEAGLSFAVGKRERLLAVGSASWYDQHIDDWILWLSTPKGFFSPRNIKQVHAYGVEMQASPGRHTGPDWKLTMNGTLVVPVDQRGRADKPRRQSVGKQLPYERSSRPR